MGGLDPLSPFLDFNHGFSMIRIPSTLLCIHGGEEGIFPKWNSTIEARLSSLEKWRLIQTAEEIKISEKELVASTSRANY